MSITPDNIQSYLTRITDNRPSYLSITTPTARIVCLPLSPRFFQPHIVPRTSRSSPPVLHHLIPHRIPQPSAAALCSGQRTGGVGASLMKHPAPPRPWSQSRKAEIKRLFADLFVREVHRQAPGARKNVMKPIDGIEDAHAEALAEFKRQFVELFCGGTLRSIPAQPPAPAVCKEMRPTPTAAEIGSSSPGRVHTLGAAFGAFQESSALPAELIFLALPLPPSMRRTMEMWQIVVGNSRSFSRGGKCKQLPSSTALERC
ncbi:hypothetical protein DXG01_016758 [Tephrocybe rancida]|nr:hypothetical protein DXG01_016758 [Tephrocybe rancida]